MLLIICQLDIQYIIITFIFVLANVQRFDLILLSLHQGILK